MKVAFVDELSKSLSESELWQAAITRRVFISSKKIKRDKISSCVLKNDILSRTREDEKKDEKVEPELILEVSPDLLRKLNYIESQLAILGGKLRDDESRTLANGAHDTLYNIILYLEKQVQKVRSQKSDWPFGCVMSVTHSLWLLVTHPLKYELMTLKITHAQGDFLYGEKLSNIGADERTWTFTPWGTCS